MNGAVRAWQSLRCNSRIIGLRHGRRPTVVGDEGQKVAWTHQYLVTPADYGARSAGPIDRRLPFGAFGEVNLSGAAIEAVRYSGNVLGHAAQHDAATITGPLDRQIRDAVNFARRNTRVAARKSPGRVEIPLAAGTGPPSGGECRNGAVVQCALLVPAPCQPFFLFVLSGLFANRDPSHCAAYLTEILPPVPGDGV